MQKKPLLVLWLIIFNSCISVPNVKLCTVSGNMSGGAICSTSNSHKTSEMTMDEYLDFLEPQESPARGGAICQSAADFNRTKTALEQACRMLGANKCKFEK